MSSIYHEGEIKVQTRAGSSEIAIKLGRTIYPIIAHVFVDFIQSQPMVILGSVDSNGMVWTSILCGQPGFMKVMDERTLHIKAFPHDADPLCENLRGCRELGLLVIDLATRRRLRLNGIVVIGPDGFSLETRQVYSNCPRYIQSRTYELNKEFVHAPRVARQANVLSEKHQHWIRQADTFFIASFHPLSGVDASHRGGFRGFVQVVDERTLVWPDYNGNGMFNTLGNIIENPNCGLLFIDFEQGGTLHLSGTAEIIWDKERADSFPGAERIVQFKILKVLDIDNAIALRWKLVEYSEDNPWFC